MSKKITFTLSFIILLIALFNCSIKYDLTETLIPEQEKSIVYQPDKALVIIEGIVTPVSTNNGIPGIHVIADTSTISNLDTDLSIIETDTEVQGKFQLYLYLDNPVSFSLIIKAEDRDSGQNGDYDQLEQTINVNTADFTPGSLSPESAAYSVNFQLNAKP